MHCSDLKDSSIVFFKALACKISSIISYVEIGLENVDLSSVCKLKQDLNKDRHKILIFSCDSVYSKKLTDHLILRDYIVVSADTVSLFNILFCNNFYNLIILDLSSDNDLQLILNLLKSIKNNSIYELVPVIVISNINKREIIQTFIEEQVDDYFLRNLDLLLLDIKISDFLEKKRL
ncbi:hypothetical protein [Borrelia coriaceae]|nr:hypothetical protein [Borrelia coriaceae]